MLSFILLSWNSEKYLKKCSDSIIVKCKAEDISYEIVIIDNGSRDASIQIIERYERRYPKSFKKITLAENAGTTYPRNLGLRQARGEYVCVLDSDTELLGGKLCSVMETLRKNPEIGIVAPKIWTLDGQIQNSVKKFPAFWQKIVKIPKLIIPVDPPFANLLQALMNSELMNGHQRNFSNRESSIFKDL